MRWTEEQEVHQRSFVMRDGVALQISVDDEESPWAYFSMSFGKFVKDLTFSECLEIWPKEAIAEARKRLDSFEEKLDANT